MPVQRSIGRPDRLFFAALLLISAAAAAGALLARWDHSLNVDEPFTALALAQPLPALLETLRHDNTPAMYLALKAWTTAAGESETALRSLSALFFGLTVLVTGLAGFELGGTRCGGLASLLVATSGRVGLLHAATVRPYALAGLLAATAAWLTIAAIRRGSRGRGVLWTALVVTHLVGLFTHPVYVFMAIGSAAAAGAALGSRGRPFAVAALAALGIYGVTWGWMVRATMMLPATAWLAPPHPIDLWNSYLSLWGNRNGFILAGATIALLTATGAWTRILGDPLVRFAGFIAAFATIGPFAASYVRPVFHATRTPTLALPLIALTVAVIVARLGTRILAVLLAGSLVVGGAQYVSASRRAGDPDPTRASVARVLEGARCGDVLISAGLSYAPITYYLDRLDAAACIAHAPFPREIALHPGWIDAAAVARDRDGYEREAASIATQLARSADRVFVFSKRQGIGAQAGELIGAELSRGRPLLETLPLRGAFFDRVLVYGRAAGDRMP